MMNKIILADSEAIFRTGTAKVLAMDEDFHIVAHCASVERMMHAIVAFPGAIVLFASSLHPNMEQLLTTLKTAGSLAIVVAEDNENVSEYRHKGFRGMIFRSVTGTALVKCVRQVALGGTCMAPQLAITEVFENDMVGTRVLQRLTPKEVRVVALIVKGCKNREIAIRLKTTEQVIKNYLRAIFDKTGVSDRLELALFTLHHSVLAEAAVEVGISLEAEEQEAAPTAVAQTGSVYHACVLPDSKSRRELEAFITSRV